VSFCKLYDTEHGQVLVMLCPDDNGEPEVRIFHRPPGHEVCSMAFGFSGDWERAQAGFDKVDEDMARAAAATVRHATSNT